MNYAILVDPNVYYQVTYTIKQHGERIYGDFHLLGADLTEKQIKKIVSV